MAGMNRGCAYEPARANSQVKKLHEFINLIGAVLISHPSKSLALVHRSSKQGSCAPGPFSCKAGVVVKSDAVFRFGKEQPALDRVLGLAGVVASTVQSPRPGCLVLAAGSR